MVVVTLYSRPKSESGIDQYILPSDSKVSNIPFVNFASAGRVPTNGFCPLAMSEQAELNTIDNNILIFIMDYSQSLGDYLKTNLEIIHNYKRYLQSCQIYYLHPGKCKKHFHSYLHHLQ